MDMQTLEQELAVEQERDDLRAKRQEALRRGKIRAHQRRKHTAQIADLQATIDRFEGWGEVLTARHDAVEAEMEPLKDHRGDPRKYSELVLLETELRALVNGFQPSFGQNPLYELAVAGGCERLYRGGPPLITDSWPGLFRVGEELVRLAGDLADAKRALEDVTD